MINRRNLITGAAALSAYAVLPTIAQQFPPIGPGSIVPVGPSGNIPNNGLITPPVGFTTPAPELQIFRQYGVVSNTYDPNNYLPTITGNQYFLNCNNGTPPSGWGAGSDGNNGLSKATPFATLRKIIAVISLQSASFVHGCQFVCGSVQLFTNAWNGNTLTKSAVIQSVDGSRIISAPAWPSTTAPVWTKTGGQTNVYQAALTSTPFFAADFTHSINGSAAITTVGNGALTAAALSPASSLVAAPIERSGPVAAFSDTTDTATNIIAALPSSPAVGYQWQINLVNLTNFAQTIVGGVGVTVAGVSVIPPKSTGVFFATYAAAGAVILTTQSLASNAFAPLNLVASIALCDSTPGSFFYDGSTTVYVHCIDSRAADANILPLCNVGGGNGVVAIQAANSVLWVNNIDFVGGASSMANSSNVANARTYWNNCSAQLTFNGQGFIHFGVPITSMTDYYYRSGSYNTNDDGFSQVGTGIGSNDGPSKIEIECSGQMNGYNASTFNNGSTSHSACKTVTINCNFNFALDRVVADAGQAQRWGIGGTWGPSRGVNGASSMAVGCGSGGGIVCQFWLDGVSVLKGSVYDLEVQTGDILLFKGAIPAGLTNAPTSTGTVGTY